MLPTQMKAVQLVGHGDMDKLVYREDVPVPQPAAGEVLIEVSACGMNNTDVWVREGAYGTETDPSETSTWRRGRSTLSFPRIQGTDTVGHIVAVGEGVPETRIGERVLVTGAAGGVGSGIVQLCRARGAIPYAVTSRGKEDALREIGAEAVVLRDEGDLVEAVEAVTDGHPIDVVADLVAGPVFNDLLRILRPEGRYTTAGAFAGPVVQLDLRTLYLKHLELHGSSQGTRGAFRRLVDYIEGGKVRPLLERTYPLSEFHRAQTDFINKRFIGKLVVVPDAKWESVGAPYAG